LEVIEAFTGMVLEREWI